MTDPTTINSGLDRNHIFTIFYSTHEETEPNFILEVRDVFDEENRLDALYAYAARIIRFFGKLFLFFGNIEHLSPMWLEFWIIFEIIIFLPVKETKQQAVTWINNQRYIQ